ncbi:MAG: alpha/beta hydrolase [Flavobacteriales bacterium]
MGIERKRAGRFNYIDAGSGFPLILLHGLMGNLSNFSETIAHFSKKNYRVIAPCLPMYELPLLKTNVTSFAQYLDELIKWLAIKRVTLIGNSLGGHIALIYTKRRPEMIHSVVLTGSSGLYENAVGNSFPKRKNVEYIRKKALDVFHDPDMVTDELVAELFELVNDRNKIIKTLSVAKSAIRHNMARELAAFRMPFCLIWGRNDKVTPPDVAEDFHRLLPDSDLYWIDHCGHAPMMEKPEEFNEILDKWLSRFAHLTHAN